MIFRLIYNSTNCRWVRSLSSYYIWLDEYYQVSSQWTINLFVLSRVFHWGKFYYVTHNKTHSIVFSKILMVSGLVHDKSVAAPSSWPSRLSTFGDDSLVSQPADRLSLSVLLARTRSLRDGFYCNQAPSSSASYISWSAVSTLMLK